MDRQFKNSVKRAWTCTVECHSRVPSERKKIIPSRDTPPGVLSGRRIRIRRIFRKRFAAYRKSIDPGKCIISTHNTTTDGVYSCAYMYLFVETAWIRMIFLKNLQKQRFRREPPSGAIHFKPTKKHRLPDLFDEIPSLCMPTSQIRFHLHHTLSCPTLFVYTFLPIRIVMLVQVSS